MIAEEHRRAIGAARTALVTGGAGFIGSHLCDALLAAGAQVTCLDNLHTGVPENVAHLRGEARFEFVEADVVDPMPAMVEQRRFTHVYHLACPASPPYYQADPERTMLTCVLGTRNMLRLAERTGARFLLASSSEVYGDPEVHPQPEGYLGGVNCGGPRACYQEGKRAGEALAFDFARAGRADVRVARIFNTYGPRMRPDDGRIVSNAICRALTGAPIVIHGDGRQTRSFCYVGDMIDGLMRLMDAEATGEATNLGNPAELTINDLVARVLALTGSRSVVRHEPAVEDDPRRRCPDIGRARAMLGWEPRVGLAEGLVATTDWFAAGDRCTSSEGAAAMAAE